MLSEFEERKLMEMVELMNEDKSRYIKRNNILSDEEKEKALEFFKSHANLESKVKWQGKDEEVANDILYLMNSTQEKKEKKEKEKESYRGNVSFDSNWKVYKETPSWIYAIPLNKEAAKFADSYACGGQGARWCIGARDENKNMWDHYFNKKGSRFLMAFNKKCTMSEEEYTKRYYQDERSTKDIHCTDGLKYMIEIPPNDEGVEIFTKDDGKLRIPREDIWNRAAKISSEDSLFRGISFQELKEIPMEIANMNGDVKKEREKRFIFSICDKLKLSPLLSRMEIIKEMMNRLIPDIYSFLQEEIHGEFIWEDGEYVLFYSKNGDDPSLSQRVEENLLNRLDILLEKLPNPMVMRLPLEKCISLWVSDIVCTSISPWKIFIIPYGERNPHQPLIFMKKGMKFSDMLLLSLRYEDFSPYIDMAMDDDTMFAKLFSIWNIFPNTHHVEFLTVKKDNGYALDIYSNEIFLPILYHGKSYYYYNFHDDIPLHEKMDELMKDNEEFKNLAMDAIMDMARR